MTHAIGKVVEIYNSYKINFDKGTGYYHCWINKNFDPISKDLNQLKLKIDSYDAMKQLKEMGLKGCSMIDLGVVQ